MIRDFALGLVLLAASGAACCEDLIAVYEQALTSDPLIREADANRKATREARPQAVSALLPQISGTASYFENKFEGESDQAQIIDGTISILSQPGTRKPEDTDWNVTLRQNIFRWENWVTLKRASREVAQAEADYQAFEQDLRLRVSIAYFEVLAGRDNVQAQESNLEAVSRQLEQAEKRFEVGLIAITDVQESRAARDNAAAELIAAKRALATAEELLREITGQKYTILEKPGDTLPLKSPEPASEDQWVQVSMDQNLALISSRLAADIARDDVRNAFGGHLPTLDFVASRGNSSSTTTQTFPDVPAVELESDTDATLLGLEFTLPIFSGGFTQSRVRQQEYLWQASRERLERVSRETERQARDAYLGVTSEISRVTALKQAFESSRTALRATEAGFEVGTRTTVDVLAARRNVVQAFTSLSRAKYDYLLNVLRLEQAAGTLDRGTLEEINAWLDEPTTPTPRPTTPPATR